MALATATQVEVALRARYANDARPDERPTLRDAEAVFKQLREMFQLAYAFGVANRWNTPILYDPREDSPFWQGPIPTVASVQVGSLEILTVLQDVFVGGGAAGALITLIERVFTMDVRIKARREEYKAAAEEFQANRAEAELRRIDLEAEKLRGRLPEGYRPRAVEVVELRPEDTEPPALESGSSP